MWNHFKVKSKINIGSINLIDYLIVYSVVKRLIERYKDVLSLQRQWLQQVQWCVEAILLLQYPGECDL